MNALALSRSTAMTFAPRSNRTRKMDKRTVRSLEAVEKACAEEAKNKFPNFSIPNIGRRSSSLGGPSAGTIANPTTTGLAYQSIIERFAALHSPKATRRKPAPKENWFELIRDPKVREHVETLFAYIDILELDAKSAEKRISEPLVLSSQGHGEMPNVVKPGLPALLPIQAAAMRQSIDPKHLARVGLAIGDRGRIVNEEGHTIFPPGFVSAMELILGVLPKV